MSREGVEKVEAIFLEILKKLTLLLKNAGPCIYSCILFLCVCYVGIFTCVRLDGLIIYQNLCSSWRTGIYLDVVGRKTRNGKLSPKRPSFYGVQLILIVKQFIPLYHCKQYIHQCCQMPKGIEYPKKGRYSIWLVLNPHLVAHLLVIL